MEQACRQRERGQLFRAIPNILITGATHSHKSQPVLRQGCGHQAWIASGLEKTLTDLHKQAGYKPATSTCPHHAKFPDFQEAHI